MTVKPTFWVVAVILGLPIPAELSDSTALYLAGWAAVVFFSVFTHELGHAFSARRFGAEVEITLHLMGGFTTWATPRPISPLRRVAVASAGSAVGFGIAGLVYLALWTDVLVVNSRLPAYLISALVFVNVFWGVINWLPIRPLDGGHILSGFLQAALGRKARAVTDVVFPLTTVAVGLFAYLRGFVFAAVFCAFLLLDEVRTWQDRRPGPPPMTGGGGLPPALG